MSVIPDGGLAAKVRSILSDAESMVALSRKNPGAFFEQKDDLVQRLKELHADARDAETGVNDRRPKRDTVFHPGRVVSRRGHVAIAEVRRSRQVVAR